MAIDDDLCCLTYFILDRLHLLSVNYKHQNEDEKLDVLGSPLTGGHHLLILLRDLAESLMFVTYLLHLAPLVFQVINLDEDGYPFNTPEQHDPPVTLLILDRFVVYSEVLRPEGGTLALSKQQRTLYTWIRHEQKGYQLPEGQLSN